MGYPQQYPGQYEPYPGGYAMPPVKPGGGTAITAGVLASIGSLVHVVGGGYSLATLSVLADELGEIETSTLDQLRTFTILTSSVGLLAGALLGVGAVTLFMRKPIGRILIASGCGLVIVMQLLSMTMMATMFGDLDDDGAIVAVAGVTGVIGMIFPIITLVLVLLPPTARWLAYQPAPAGNPYGQPPMGYGQPNPYGQNPAAGFAPQPGIPPAGFAPQPGVPPAGFAPQPGVPAGGFAPQPGFPPADSFANAPTQLGPGAAQPVDEATQVVGGDQRVGLTKPEDDPWRRPSA
ncbi:hypothetical protein ACFVMC_05515 [Nocardia sp. NPDC127579]|uniref:hypothetical protein n=1 Tax=Nocardia sp. NPDC127579 TaxID=3345402 RepID=UPI003644A607